MESEEKLVFVGNEEMQQGGVAIVMSARAKGALMEWTPISKRIFTARFYSKYKKLTVVQAYDQQMMRWMRKRMNSITSCRTLFQTTTEMMIVVTRDLNA